MKLILTCIVATLSLSAQDLAARARQMHFGGNAAAARSLLRQAVRDTPRDPAALTAWAEFLDHHNDAEARDAYGKLADVLPAGQRRTAVLRRLAILHLMAGDRAAAESRLRQYREAGGTSLPAAFPERKAAAIEVHGTIEIPGPLNSFARMAALSPDLRPEDVLPALARNVVTNGYQASSSAEALDMTEFLKLAVRYLSQARELTKLAGEGKVIRIETCESQQTGDLLRVLGYRMRGGCGSEVVLETVNATRAFLTIDSGFPIAELEQALRTNRPFVYNYAPTKVPVLYPPDYLLSSRERQGGEFIDVFLADPALCRLYLGLSKLDRETATELTKAVPAQRLRAFAHVLDFFGGMFQIRQGRAVIPGGARTAAMWAELAGAPPDQGAAFIERLISRDDGWMASYFDALLRIHGPVQEYLTEPERMKRFYLAIRGRVTSPGPARPVFRSNTDMMLLTTRLRMDAAGRPHIPGGIDVWKNLFVDHPHGRYDGRLTRLATSWKEPDDVLEALFALCRKAVENEPLKIFMALSDLNRRREQPLAAETVDRLARSWRGYGSQYALFSEAPGLSDKTILLFLDVAASISQIRDQLNRADTAGTMQALAGLWQIFVRSGAIPPAQADESLSALLTPFLKARGDRELFEAGYNGVRTLLRATGSAANVNVQDRMLDLLAGAARPVNNESHQLMLQEMIRVFEAQRLFSLKTILDIADHLEALAKGEKLNTTLIGRLSTRSAEIQLPRASLTGVEKNAFAFGYWTERHVERQRRLNLRAAAERAGTDADRLRDARAMLTPLLRDTLVGFNYIHYAPPGAQVLITNPLFVRSHDFLGVQGTNQTWRSTEVFGTGWPSNAGGRLVGSLASLPYALAEAEQNFMIPSREQALIWGDLVPQMILSAKIPRWWGVAPAQMHYVGLHIRLGESTVAEAVIDSSRRARVVETIERLGAPARAQRVAGLLEEGNLAGALEYTTPIELVNLATSVVAAERQSADGLVREILRLQAESPDHVSAAAISRAFGTPKPTLTSSYQPELLHLRTFPTLMGYSSRIMAESWESSILYYAALADEIHMPPAQLNVAIPQWTQRTVEQIFATHLEDWPALLRSLRVVADGVRENARKQRQEAQQAASLR
jgi:hypothetical protein